jgi:Uma2 family endonuclease
MKIGELTVTRLATDVPGPPQGQWTYEDVRALPEDGNRYEVLNGVLYVSPGPTPNHQRRLFRLSRRMADLVDSRELGEWFIAPTDLVMPGATPVEPDAFFVAATNTSVEELETHLEGAPDLVVEVASPSTASYDRRQKQDAYARAGVPEYWIVDPSALAIEVLVRDAVEASYRSLGVFFGGRRLTSTVFGDLPHSVEELFA